MVKINFATREVSCKVVYYGPGMSGKTTNLEVIHQKAPRENTGELTSISTEGDRTLFFDYMPMEIGTIKGMKTSFQVYTVPGQVMYDATRKIVLMGADGIIFVADSRPEMLEENRESLENLRINLAEQGRELTDIPMVFQWNKQDLPAAMKPEELERLLNSRGLPAFSACAVTGVGVFPTFLKLSKMVVADLSRDYGPRPMST